MSRKEKGRVRISQSAEILTFFMVIRMARNEARLLGSVITQGESQ
jgi:hypothetical protein